MKEGEISARKAGLLWGLSMKKSTLQFSDRQIEVPSPVFFSNEKMKKKTVKVPRQGNKNYTIFKQPLAFPTIPWFPDRFIFLELIAAKFMYNYVVIVVAG